MRIPSDEEIRRLHERYAPSAEAFELVYTHCEIVCRIAEQLLLDQPARSGAAVDADLVRAGCLLHDIGVYRLYGPSGVRDQGPYITHGILGHGLLREAGFAETLGRFCSCHTGVGLTREDVVGQGLPLPVADYVAETGEELLVMYADKFHSKSNPPVFHTFDGYAASVVRFGADKVVRFAAMREQFGEPVLDGLSEEYGHLVKE